MAKDFMAKKSNSHMNGFGMMDISKGHKHLGKAPMSGDMEPAMSKNKNKMKSDKMEDKSGKKDPDFSMEDVE